MDVPNKFSDSRSNGFRDIQGADVVSNERTNIGEAYPNSAKRKRVSPKKNRAKFDKERGNYVGISVSNLNAVV